ncbi:MAG: UvrD-helicase domain-containing protein [Gammaproteobacteria bacterium]|nr:UvrD-helicase domain-containing protein [Gammaproteobacteria bacterium]
MPDLNSRQKEAVRYMAGPLLVLAGAGSGKTSVITRKIVALIREHGIDPSRIVAVTFTNKAAREMKTRVAALLGGGAAKGLAISTFHTLGLRILRAEGAHAGYRAGLSIYDSTDSLGLIRDLAHNSMAEDIQRQISRWKNAMVEPEHAMATAGTDPLAAQAAKLYPLYQRHLKACNAVDFDDLILEPALIFARHPDVLSAWQDRIRYLLVDEYQDTNACQYSLVRQLVGTRGALTVVGDDDQSVYAWRGARPENLLQLQQDFPNLKVIKLEQNYRSAGRILKAANSLIRNNPHVYEKRLWSDLGYGDPIRVIVARDEEHEADRVVAQLLHHKFKHRTDFRDYALLYRGNHQARVLERALREQRIPYYLSGGISFFEHSEIRDVMGYLRLVANPADNSAFLRVANTPRREIGAATLEGLARYAAENGLSLTDASFADGLALQLNSRQLAALRRFTTWISALAERAPEADPAGLAREIVAEAHYDAWLQETSDSPAAAQKRQENVADVLDWLRRLTVQDGELSFADAVARISLIGMLDNNDPDASIDQVSLMTLHAAKGLEFPHVYLVGMEENLLPHRTSVEQDTVDEERRLAYVGITRARKTLSFSLARCRKRYGEIVDCEPSRFLAELPADDLEWQDEAASANPQERQERADAHLANLRGLLDTS